MKSAQILAVCFSEGFSRALGRTPTIARRARPLTPIVPLDRVEL